MPHLLMKIPTLFPHIYDNCFIKTSELIYEKFIDFFARNSVGFRR
jgi:hypothetical protein